MPQYKDWEDYKYQPIEDYAARQVENAKTLLEQEEEYDFDKMLGERFKATEAAGLGGGRSGGGRSGGGGYTPQDIAQLKDRFAQMTQQLTGYTPDQMGTSFEWFKPKWEGGWSQGDFERHFRSTNLFKETYPGIQENMSVDEWNSLASAANDYSLQWRGGKGMTKEEIGKMVETGEVPF